MYESKATGQGLDVHNNTAEEDGGLGAQACRFREEFTEL